MNLTIEQMREIVDGAPEDCDAYETDTYVFDLSSHHFGANPIDVITHAPDVDPRAELQS